jgi:hypothetical protein
LEAITESSGGLSGAVLKVDVDSEEITDLERLAALAVVKHPLVLLEMGGSSVETG